MVKIYAVIDTNVLVSALLSRFKNTSTIQLLQLDYPKDALTYNFAKTLSLILPLYMHSPPAPRWGLSDSGNLCLDILYFGVIYIPL